MWICYVQAITSHTHQLFSYIHIQLDILKQYLKWWREVTARDFPNRPDLLQMIPTPNGIDIAKLGDCGALSSETCTSARKTRRILVELIEKQDGIIYELDCVQHLRYVWFNGAAKSVSTFLAMYLEDSLEEISSFLCVNPDLAQVICAYHKEFSLTANYPKWHGERFCAWMIKNYPKEYLMHAERALGSRQDLICMGSMAIFKNRVPNIEFLDDQLHICSNNHILQHNLFIILSSLWMIATSRIFSILNVDICMHVRWLAGNTHKLAHHNWGARSIGRVFDILHTSLNNILDYIPLIHCK